jgi:hypothetical protein
VEKIDVPIIWLDLCRRGDGSSGAAAASSVSRVPSSTLCVNINAGNGQRVPAGLVWAAC